MLWQVEYIGTSKVLIETNNWDVETYKNKFVLSETIFESRPTLLRRQKTNSKNQAEVKTKQKHAELCK